MFSFRSFHGDEPEPKPLEDYWRSCGIAGSDLILLIREYQEARNLWLKAVRGRAPRHRDESEATAARSRR